MGTNREWFNQQKYGKGNISYKQGSQRTTKSSKKNTITNNTIATHKVVPTTNTSNHRDIPLEQPTETNKFNQFENSIDQELSENKMGVVSFILGILGILGLGCGIMSILALIIGLKNIDKVKNRRFCTIGITLGIIGILEPIIIFIAMGTILN